MKVVTPSDPAMAKFSMGESLAINNDVTINDLVKYLEHCVTCN